MHIFELVYLPVTFIRLLCIKHKKSSLELLDGVGR